MNPEQNSARRNETLGNPAATWPAAIRSLRAPALTLAALALLTAASAGGQVTAQFSAAQIAVPTGTLSYPYRVAVDASGNVYISDTQNNRVLKETLAPSGGYTETVVASTGLAAPYGVAVDSVGNVYIADNGHNRVLREAPSGASYVETVVTTSALSYPTGVAVDLSNNLYIADTSHGRILQEIPMGGSYVETVISASGLPQITGIAVDSNGNVFVSDVDSMQVYEETRSGLSYTQSTVPTTGLNYPYDIAVDANDDLYISDFSNDRIVKETFFAGAYTQSVYPAFALEGALGLALDATGDLYIADTFGQTVWKSSAAGGNFGPVNVGTASSTGYLIFDFVGSSGFVTLGSTPVLTQGATGLDYAASGGGDCQLFIEYVAGDSCAVSVQLTPQFPGQRMGAGELLDASNNILASGYITGSGVGPQVNFLPGAPILLAGSETLNPQGLAVDASGNVYFADFANDQVLKVTPLGMQTTVADSTSGMGAPEAVAVDGAGNVYIADSTYNQILKATPSAGTYSYQTIADSCFDALASPGGVAVDGLGNVYVADTNNNRLLKETPSGGNYTQSVIPTTGLARPFGVAVDAAGNLYVADLTNNRIVLEALSGGVYTQSTIVAGLSEPTSVFVDVNDNVYIADYGSGRILKETLSSGTYTQSAIVSATGISFYGVALDGAGNVYGTDVTGDLVFKLDVVDPPVLSFDSSNVGTQSSDSPQIVTMLNFGDANLTLPIPDAGTDPRFSGGSFTLDASTTCPQVLSIGPSGSLAMNVTCVYAIDFSPATTGSISDGLVLVDNNLNRGNSVQTIAVSGTGLTAAPTATVITLTALPVATSPFGQSVTLTANLAPFAAGGQSTNGEAVTFKSGATTLGTGLLASGVASLTLTTLPAGVDSLTAAFAGDVNFAASVSTALSYTVSKITPVITWATPAQITFGTALSSTQLDATSLVAGTFVYTPAAGSIPAGGMDTLSVTLTPTDTVTYSNATATVTLAVYDVGLSVIGNAGTQTVLQGAAATFPFTTAPLGATTFANPVSFSVTGLPVGATAVFTPATIPAGSASTPVSLVVQTSAAASGAITRNPFAGRPLRNAPVALTLLLLPILGLQAFRKRLRAATSTRALVLLVALVVGAVAALGGCTGTTSARGTSYPLVVTATSGTLHTSFNMTLIVDK